MTGNIIVYCDSCGSKLRVQVDFPSYNKGFVTKQVVCPYCGIELRIYDEHKYNKDGTIVE